MATHALGQLNPDFSPEGRRGAKAAPGQPEGPQDEGQLGVGMVGLQLKSSLALGYWEFGEAAVTSGLAEAGPSRRAVCC